MTSFEPPSPLAPPPPPTTPLATPDVQAASASSVAAVGPDVAAALAGLDETWTVYSAPRIGFDQPDFLAVHDRFGVCIIDVLDWTPENTCLLQNGEIGRLDPGGQWVPLTIDPRVSAARSRSSIFDQFFAMPEHGGSPTAAVRSVIILPAFSTVAAGSLFARSDNDSIMQVGISGGDALQLSVDEVVRGHGCEAPPAPSIEKLRRHVAHRPGHTAAGAWSASMPQAVIDIAENHDRARHRRIAGVAGSGKSSALAARAARLAAEGKFVLALSFNVTFANGLRSMVDEYCRQIGADPTLVACGNFHSFCTRVVSDAEMSGARLSSTRGAPWTVGIVEKATEAYEQGQGPLFDAVMIDEGQDFTQLWWDLITDHVLIDGGETLLSVDRTQDIYERTEWLDELVSVDGAPIETIELASSLRLPADLASLTNEFAVAHLDGTLQLPATPPADDPTRAPASVRRWGDVVRVQDIGTAVGQEVVELLRSDPSLRPGDVAFVCDYHHDGVRASAVIERAGIPVHHIFSRDPDDPRRRRKHRFWTDADAVKGCTAHSLKGWETPAVVLSIGADSRAKRLAYVAMTRARHSTDRSAIVSVVNADSSLSSFGGQFVAGSAVLGDAATAVASTPEPAPAAVRESPPVTQAPPAHVTPAPAAPPPAPVPQPQPQPYTAPVPAPAPAVAAPAVHAVPPPPPSAVPPAVAPPPPPPPPAATFARPPVD